MSDRKIADTDFAAELKASHLQQIEILTGGARRDYEAVLQFAAAARMGQVEEASALKLASQGWTAAAAVWTVGNARRSLFAYLPTCGCPVQERAFGRFRERTLIPLVIEKDWRPTRAQLEEFARVQQEARLGAFGESGA
jgi:hypothetical protein